MNFIDRKKILSIYIIFAMVTLGFVGILVFEGVIDEGGIVAASTLYVGGSGSGNWSKIQDAIDNASVGDTIRVYTGIYFEHILIQKTLTLIGNGSTNTIINGTKDGSVAIVTADFCNISGFTFQGSHGSHGSYAGLSINSSQNKINNCSFSNNNRSGLRIYGFGKIIEKNMIINCSFKFNNYYGLLIENSKENQIVNCNSSNNQYDNILTYSCDNSIFRNCTIFSSKGSWCMGILMQDSENNLIINSTCKSNNYGIIFAATSKYNTVKNCRLISNYYGIGCSALADNNNIIDCLCVGNRYRGIIFYGAGNEVVDNCTIENNLDGIFLHDSNNNLVKSNLIQNNNNFGIEIDSGINNRISNNNLINNNQGKTQSSDNGTNNKWDTGTFGNYWSDWTTPDNDLNGIVDIPYNLSGTKSAKDYYPLVKPVNTLKLLFSGNRIIYEDLYYSGTISPNIQSSNFIWNFSSNATWLNFSQDQKVYGTPTNWNIGVFWINISASKYPYYDYLNFTISVLNVNDPPRITSQDKLICYEDEIYFNDYQVIDIDPIKNTLMWILKTNSSFLIIDNNTGNLSGTPTNDNVGKFWINVSVNDGKGGMDFSNYTLTVFNTNDPPLLELIDNQVIFEDDFYKVNCNATDIDKYTILIWKFDTNANWLHWDLLDHTIYGTPMNEDVGEYWVLVNISDGNNGFDEIRFELIVLNSNDKPEINITQSDFYFKEDTIDFRINLDNWFKDIDGDKLIFYYKGDNNINATIFKNNSVKLEPKQNWNGEETLTFYANDSFFEISDDVTITVLPVNDAPTNPVIMLAEMIYYEGKYQPAIGNATDVDIPYGDELTFIWYSNITGKIGIGKELNLSLPSGIHTITLNVSDKEDAWTLVSMEFEIQKFDDGLEDKKDSDNDGYLDDIDAFLDDPTQWLDSDGDNYGDNPNGTNPDYYPNDSSKWKKEDEPPTKKDPAKKDDSALLIVSVAIIIIILVVILLFFLLIKRKKKVKVEQEPQSAIDTEKQIQQQLSPQPQQPQIQSTIQPQQPQNLYPPPYQPPSPPES